MTLKKMTAADVAKKVINQEPLFILDVRSEEAYADWKIEGKQITSLNKPYFNLLDGVDEIVDELPKDETILVVCAKEGSSKFVGEMLVEAGFRDIRSFENGMKAWSEHLEPVKVGDLSTGGSVYQFVRLGKGCLSYLITSGNEAVIIDPVRTIEPFTKFADEQGLTIKHVIDTHLHADHISGARSLREETGATYWLPARDAEEVVYDFEDLTEESEITLNNDTLALDVIYSPGHTIGSTSISVDDKYLFTGDILFVHSIGRPDLAGEAGNWASHLRETLYKRYKEMSDELIVLPAHFSQISELNKDGSIYETLGHLFEFNDGLQIEDADEFHKKVSENLPDQPNSFKMIRQTNMGKESPDQDEQQEMEIGPNRCAVN